MMGKIEGRRRRGKKNIRWLDSITDSMDMNLSKRIEEPGRLQSMELQRVRNYLATATATIHHFSIIIMQIFSHAGLHSVLESH